MRHEAVCRMPTVDRHRGGLGDVARPTSVEGERHLGPGARPAAGDGAAERCDDRAVHVPAHDADHLIVPSDHLGLTLGADEADLVHPVDAGHERRMVLEHERGSVRVGAQHSVEPVHLAGSHAATVLARHRRVETHQSHGEMIDHVIEASVVLGDPWQVREDPAHLAAVVVIPGNGVHRERQPTEDLGEMVVLGRSAVVHEVARGEHRVGCRRQGEQVIDRRMKSRSRVDTVVEQRTGLDDVAVGDLRQMDRSGRHERRAYGLRSTRMSRSSTVIEFLTFHVPVGEREDWLAVEEQHWSRYLERQDGFVRKEMWVSAANPETVHAVIWWASLEQWKAIPADELAAVEAAMGEHERTATCDTYELLRSC